MLLKNIYITFFWIVIAASVFPQNHFNRKSSLIIGENYRIYPSSVTQTEVFIVKSPVDENVLFSSGNTLTFIPFFISEGIYVTTNGGNSWQGSDSCTGEPILFHGGDPGITIDRNGTFIITRLGRSPFAGLYSHYSTDNGQTWSFQNAISTDDLERATITTDAITTSSFYGRTYAAWVKLSTPFSLAFAFTDDGAQNWSTPQQINNPTNRSAGGDITTGPNGEVYVCWAGVTDVSPFREIFVGFASASNGGANWNVTENAFDVNGITGVLANKGNIRVNGLPSIAVDTTNGPNHGKIYIVTGQKDLAPAGSDPDIILNRSTDGGQTWSPAIRVNQDTVNNGKTQYFPTVHIDKFGAVNVIFYDDRNTSNDSAGVFLARSTDGGDSWTEFEISDHNYKPVPIGGLGQGYQGDNIDITSTSSKLWPVWMDNSTGIYQIWTSAIDIDNGGNENNAPDIVPIEDQIMMSNDSLTVLVSALDPDGDNITLSFNNLPLFSFAVDNGDGTGEIIFHPTTRDTGHYSNIEVIAIDNNTIPLSSSEFFSLEVQTVEIQYFYKLNQNYPNPFNSSTTIEYSLQDRNYVTLAIFDVLGNVVLILINEEKPAGSYQLKFNANGLPSGIYFYQLKVESFVETKSMVLLK